MPYYAGSHCNFILQAYTSLYCLMTARNRVAWPYWVRDTLMVRPRFVVCDYEWASLNSATECYSESKMTGCLFHVTRVMLTSLALRVYYLQKFACSWQQTYFFGVTHLRLKLILSTPYEKLISFINLS